MYAQRVEDTPFATLVRWNGRICGVWDARDDHAIGLVPLDVVAAEFVDEETYSKAEVFTPVRQIQLLVAEKANPETVRALFRLDMMPWELAVEGKYPFSSATSRYAYTEHDILTIIDRLAKFRNPFLLEAWQRVFMGHDGTVPRLIHPVADRPCFTLKYLSWRLFDLVGWFDPVTDDWSYLLDLRDAYLQSKDKPLAEMVIPASFRSDMIPELEEYVKSHSVTDEIRSFYASLLKEGLDSGDPCAIKIYAYAYYGGNDIVPCDWQKAEQALRMLFDPEADPPCGDPSAANSLGYIYGSDRLGSADWEKAFRCFSYGAEHGSTESTYKLSDLYRKGLGVAQDSRKAWDLISKLYLQSDKRQITRGKYADIVLRMGYCYRDGIGVLPDKACALRYFLEAKRAIEARMKKHPGYGDTTVAQNIEAAIESIKGTSK